MSWYVTYMSYIFNPRLLLFRFLSNRQCLSRELANLNTLSTTVAASPNNRQQTTLGLKASACASIPGISQTSTRTPIHTAESIAMPPTTPSFLPMMENGTSTRQLQSRLTYGWVDITLYAKRCCLLSMISFWMRWSGSTMYRLQNTCVLRDNILTTPLYSHSSLFNWYENET
jgi:hypothetical protein